MPTGGIDIHNLPSYMALECVFACGGSWIAREEMIKAKNFNEITRLSREAVRAVHGFAFAHLGINAENEAAAGAQAVTFTELFGFSQRDIGVSIFSTDLIEIMKSPGLGEFGHIGIKCINAARAIAYFEAKGIELDYDTIKMRNNKPSFIYLTNPVGAFKVHIVQS
jgi:2-dehydro-3-deoxyphosphogluconate aldolase/(4S)-4-hydroxy-2-oxoglutarate aldolase